MSAGVADAVDELIDPDAAMERVGASVSRYLQAFRSDSTMNRSTLSASGYSHNNIDSRYSERTMSVNEFAPPLPFRS